MPIIATDWSVTSSTKNVRYIGDDHNGTSPSYATVLELHRWLQDLADDANFAGDDEIDISKELPSDKKYDSIIELLSDYNIDDASSEHLYGGSIIQKGGDEIYDGIINYGNADVQIQIIQNGAVIADDWWNYNNTGLNADAVLGASHQFMLKVRTGGEDINGRRLIGTCRRFGYTYSEFIIGAGTSRGVNTLALSDSIDLNNQTDEATVASWNAIVNQDEGYADIDVNNNGVDEHYYSKWTRAGYTINQFYERMKWLTRDGSTETIYGLNGELFRGITHSISCDNLTGTFNAFEPVSWTGGTGQLLASNNGSNMYIQLLTGSLPNDNQTITGDTSSATIDVNGTVTQRPISKPFCGSSTGSALIGAYGFGVKASDLSKNDSLISLAGDTLTPPNLATYTVNGLVAGEDRVLVAPWDGSTLDAEGNPAIDKTQLELATALTSNETSIICSTAIPTDTPSSGTLRIITNANKELLINYTSWSGSTFTIESTNFSSDNASISNGIYITYIDKLSTSSSENFQTIFSSNRNLVIIVRDGGTTPIKQFISNGLLTANGGSISPVRTSDA